MSKGTQLLRHANWSALTALLLTFVLVIAASPARATGNNDELLAATRSDDSRFIVLAVANESVTAMVRTGGTPRAYGGGSDYAVSDAARRSLRALAAQYRLQSVAAWPIALLRMQCAVFAIPEGAVREQLVAQLQSDLQHHGAMRLAVSRQRLDSLAGRLRALDPQQVLARGYAWIADADGQAVMSAQQIAVGQGLRAVLHDGSADVQVTQVRRRTSG